MKELCVLCKRVHDGQNWRYGPYESIEGERYGWFCDKWFKPRTYEFVPQRIKDDRKKYKKDILQPFRAGEPSREFIEAYPERAKKTFTKKELKRAKNVWNDI